MKPRKWKALIPPPLPAKPPTKPLFLRVPESLKAGLQAISDRTGHSMNTLGEAAIREFVLRNRKAIDTGRK